MVGRLKLFGPRSRGGVFARAAGLALIVVAALGAGAGSGRAGLASGVTRVRLGGDQIQTRVVIELDRSVKGKLESPAQIPTRVVLALPGVDVAGDLKGAGQGLVHDWRVERAGGSARVRLNLTRQAAVKRRFLLPPGDGVKVYRYVLDLEAGPGAAPVVQPQARPLPTRSVTTTPERAHSALTTPVRSGKRVVVIDAGHGGNDPGASGAVQREKAITLAAAKALKARLERTGRYRVVMTRSGDDYIALESRVSIARRAGADLFISLHADAGADRGVRGASVYTLSDRGADRAARKALTSDDWIHDGGLPGRDLAVNRILLDLTQRATKNRSASFARMLLERIDDRTPLLNRSHRDAGFAVLLAPDVPAVLLEMGFITNPQDEAGLIDPGRRARLMDAVALAVDDYFDPGRSFTTASAAP